MSPTVSVPLRISRCSMCGGSDLRPINLGTHAMQRCSGCRGTLATGYDDPDFAYDDRYHNGQSGRSVDTTLPAFQEYLARCNAERLAWLRRSSSPPGRLLDVGCARGDLLAAAAADGWTVSGLEPVDAAARAARDNHGLNVQTGTLDTVDLATESYDVITMFHVIEHLPDAVMALRRVSSLLKPGGVVVIEVPNWQSVSRRHYRQKWPHLHDGDHISHFTPRTLRHTLRRAGLKPAAMRSPSYTGTPQDPATAAADLCLGRATRLLKPFQRDGQLTTTGWRLVHGVDAIYSSARVGSVILIAARKPA